MSWPDVREGNSENKRQFGSVCGATVKLKMKNEEHHINFDQQMLSQIDGALNFVVTSVGRKSVFHQIRLLKVALLLATIKNT